MQSFERKLNGLKVSANQTITCHALLTMEGCMPHHPDKWVVPGTAVLDKESSISVLDISVLDRASV